MITVVVCYARSLFTLLFVCCFIVVMHVCHECVFLAGLHCICCASYACLLMRTANTESKCCALGQLALPNCWDTGYGHASIFPMGTMIFFLLSHLSLSPGVYSSKASVDVGLAHLGWPRRVPVSSSTGRKSCEASSHGWRLRLKTPDSSDFFSYSAQDWVWCTRTTYFPRRTPC